LEPKSQYQLALRFIYVMMIRISHELVIESAFVTN
jgi:hypothetical protein